MSLSDNPRSVALRYLEGGGEMGRLTREYNWQATSLGPPEEWPRSLLTTVSLILNSKFPMFLFWGPDLIQFYNDAYRPSLGNNGKHPTALGQRAVDCWPEIWPFIKPIIDNVMIGGEASWNEDQLLPIYRNNKLEDVYWTFSYSKARGDDGETAGVLVTCSETTDKISSYNTLKSAKRDLELAIEAAELATWDLDPKTQKFVGNDRLKIWFGLDPADEIALTDALEAIIEPDREQVAKAIADAMKKGSDGNYSAVYTIISKKDGEQRVVKASGKAVFGEDGEAYRLSGILQDVTDDYQMQQRKDEFISVASHELKTPITTLNASMQLLQKLVKTDPASVKIPFFVDKANGSLQKLVSLLDDLLNVTRIQQGQLALNKTMFNLPELVSDCSEHVRMDGNLEINITGDKELMIYADYRRIDQVLVNLVNNAVKYAPRSKQIDLHISHDDEFATVSVKDYGIGINPEKLPHLFDRYYRVDALGHQFSGLGLGLYICSEIITRHGGKIGVESEWGEGSKFWFTIPING
ncbi:ATP-binding protein [Mucilaginibacter myungsuensis]|uniref:histidine kinase n=1 Tax=Mucilaginibacter myungsuensis TaxID=649104 RepID=A0A929PV10_9SPHI|nr:ATP-binding protein [Mucilaginibacter myungsuensis]MBE9661323.1 PAS domain-containing protein [Mucilaginibacter myungsuensis]MDN3597466.1 ATP-binding protein [Mucilaginibacter myungsuensis]